MLDSQSGAADLGVGSNPIVDKNFLFCNFSMFRAPGSLTGPIQMKSSMSCIRGSRRIERKKDNFRNVGVVQRQFELMWTSYKLFVYGNVKIKISHCRPDLLQKMEICQDILHVLVC